MECPYCQKKQTVVSNSRATRGASQIWRRRKCLICSEIFTTHESIDLSAIFVVKKSGRAEKYSMMKLYSGIFKASQSSVVKKREVFLDKIVSEIEQELLGLRQKRIGSQKIGEIVLTVLRKRHTPTFLRFLTYYKDIATDAQMKREITKYLE